MVEPSNYNLAQSEALKKDSNGSRYLYGLFNAFIPDTYDEITLTYDGQDVDTVIYKLDDSVVGTLQLIYEDNKFVGMKRI